MKQAVTELLRSFGSYTELEVRELPRNNKDVGSLAL